MCNCAIHCVCNCAIVQYTGGAIVQYTGCAIVQNTACAIAYCDTRPRPWVLNTQTEKLQKVNISISAVLPIKEPEENYFTDFVHKNMGERVQVLPKMKLSILGVNVT